MNLFNAVILGIVEGLTEFLPISSTGHLILTARLLGILQTDFLKSFEITIQLGAILSVVVLYRRQLFTDWGVLKRVACAFLPTAILGLAFYKIVKKFLLGSDKVVIWALFTGGALLILFELLHREKASAEERLSEIPYSKSILIGVFQAVAIIPGVSRAAATICGGLLLGLKRKTIVEFSFLLAVPTMLAATGLDLINSAAGFSLTQLTFLLTGFVTSFIVALIGIKLLLGFIKRHNFIPFGIYRIIVALGFLWVR
ncbi:MAG: undecaprenyl-diphosphate phosphatase [Candidatus Omnitrophica bacterium]|nr:undecaprenyl-diphosphate phosphatase [Candidatus Omnitrophota bacterium]